MPINEIAKHRLANLKRGKSLPTSRLIGSVQCPECGFMVSRTWRNRINICPAPKCDGKLPEKPPRICRLCDSVLPGRRTSWCSDECSEAYYLLTSASFLRAKVGARDKGICAACGLDCRELRLRVNKLKKEALVQAKHVLRDNGFNVWCSWHDIDSLWDADHIEPLDEGGSWELSNVQTLCHPCHKEKTAEQASRRARQRKLIGKKAMDTNKRLKVLGAIG